MRRTSVTCIALLLMLALATAGAVPSAEAFGMTGFGGKIGYLSPENADGTVVVGGHLEFEQAGTQLHLIPSVMYWSTDGVSDLSVNADAYYHFYREGLMTPYVGAGLGLNALNFDGGGSSNDLGANLIGGLRMPGQAAHFFMEARYTISDISQFGVLGGITIHH
jgi:hypothetical protein